MRDGDSKEVKIFNEDNEEKRKKSLENSSKGKSRPHMRSI